MKIIRLENSQFGISSFCEEEIDKLILFDSESGVMRVHVLPSLQVVPFGEQLIEQTMIHECFGDEVKGEEIRLIHNRPVVNAYSAPFKLYLDINLACTLTCPFCLSGAERHSKARLTMELFEQLAAEIKRLGIFYIKIGGGDPFLHPDFEKMIFLLRSVGCFLTISTNSATMTVKRANLLAQASVRTSVSIEGLEETNDQMRGEGHFQKVLKAVDVLVEAGVQTVLRTTLLPQNLSEVPELVELAKWKGVKIRFAYCRPAGRAVTNQTMIGPEHAAEFLSVLQFLNHSDTAPFVILDEGMLFQQLQEVFPKLLRGQMCGAANRSMHIDAHERVSPCIFFGPTFSYGRIYRDGTMLDFWRGNVGNKFRTVRSIRQASECDGCSRLCKNECPANRFYFWGNFSVQDPNCLHEVQRASLRGEK